MARGQRRCWCGWASTRASPRSATRATSASTSSARPGSARPGHGGQILLSETTRALLGNDLPEGASVVDLGEAKLKDIQHEHVYQLSLDDGTRSFPPLKTEVEKDAGDLLGERIERHVTERIERG